MIWEFTAVLAYPEQFAGKIEKDVSISLRPIYDLEQDGHYPKGASRFVKEQPKMLDKFDETYETDRNSRQGLPPNDEAYKGEV